MKRKLSLMIVTILLLQIVLPMVSVIWESRLTLISNAEDNTEYYINTAQDLWDFAAEVNNGNSFKGVTVNLTANIDLGCSQDNQWIPIGIYANGFRGVFNGQKYTISGLYVGSVEYLGLFGFNFGTIKNLNISNSNIKCMSETTRGYIGFIAAENNGFIKNCTTTNSQINIETQMEAPVGGICGYNRGTIDSCTNNSNIYTEVIKATGGVVGENYGMVKKSINNGIISGNDSCNYNSVGIGGVVGSNRSRTYLCGNYGI